jgi:3-hydroxyacyl-[acyl-carrier-protein] dehydratase
MADASFVVPPTHPCLPGHFPGRPLVPGVVILDEVLAAIGDRGVVPGSCGLPQVKFMQPLLPGELASIHLEDRGAGRWRFRVLRGDALLASGDVVVA